MIIRVEGRTNYNIYYKGSRKCGEATENMKDKRGMISQAVKSGYGDHDRAKCEHVRLRTKLACCGLSGPGEGPQITASYGIHFTKVRFTNIYYNFIVIRKNIMDLMRGFFFVPKYNVMIFVKIYKRTQVPNLLKTISLTSA